MESLWLGLLGISWIYLLVVRIVYRGEVCGRLSMSSLACWFAPSATCRRRERGLLLVGS